MVARKSREEWKIHGNVFDKFTEETVFKLGSQGFFDRLTSGIALGKEANIFVANPSRGKENHVIVKIYRLENCNFKKMYEYLKQDPRYMHLKPQKRAIVFAWCQREYRNLFLAREVLEVPTPLAFKNNVLVMSLIGNEQEGIVVKQLKDHPPADGEGFLRSILEQIKKLWQHGLVHGDLSAFNILNRDEEPVFIDFSQASPTTGPNAAELLERDLKNLAQFFKKLDITIDIAKELQQIRA